VEVVHTIYILFKLIIKIKTEKNKLNIFNCFDKKKNKKKYLQKQVEHLHQRLLSRI